MWYIRILILLHLSRTFVLIDMFLLRNDIDDDVVDDDYYTIRMLQQFNDYIVHVHFDNSTLNLVNRFLNSKTNFTITLLQNYDIYDVGNYFERDDGNKYLHLIIMNEPKLFVRYSNVTFNLESTDIVMFVIRNVTEIAEEYWSIDGLDKGGCVILYDINLRNFSYVQFYCGNLTGVLQEVIIEDDGDITSVPNLRRYVNDFQNFNGHVFIVGLISNEPFAWCSNENITDADYCTLEGVEGELLKNLMQWFNFEVLLDFHNDLHTDYAYIVQKVCFN